MKGTRGAPPPSRGEMQNLYVQIAELEIDPAQFEDYKAAVEEQIATAVSKEAGVLVLYAVAFGIRPFQEVQGRDGEDDQVAQAHPSNSCRAWCEKFERPRHGAAAVGLAGRLRHGRSAERGRPQLS